MTTVTFLTDSIGLVPEAVEAQRFPAIASARLGWTPTVRGLSGSGYIADGTENLTFGDVLDADVIAGNPDVVVVEGGYNDYAQGKTAAATAAAAGLVFARLRAGLPAAVIYVTAPWWAHTVLAAEDAFTEPIRTAATGCRFIDTRNWITGTGAAGALAGDGNADLYIRGDGTDVHPTEAGATYYGDRLAHAILYPFGAGFVGSIADGDGTPIALGFQP